MYFLIPIHGEGEGEGGGEGGRGGGGEGGREGRGRGRGEGGEGEGKGGGEGEEGRGRRGGGGEGGRGGGKSTDSKQLKQCSDLHIAPWVRLSIWSGSESLRLARQSTLCSNCWRAPGCCPLVSTPPDSP